jgi:hypothetical protein
MKWTVTAFAIRCSALQGEFMAGRYLASKSELFEARWVFTQPRLSGGIRLAP